MLLINFGKKLVMQNFFLVVYSIGNKSTCLHHEKTFFYIYENNDQLCGNCAADQHLFVTKIDYNPTSEIRNFKPVASFCGCTVQFVSDKVGKREDRFFRM